MKTRYTYKYTKNNDIRNKKRCFSVSKIFVIACIPLILSTCNLFFTESDAEQNGPSIVAVSAISDYSFVITNMGELYGWGSNHLSELGLGDTKTRNTPTKVNVAGVEGWRSVSAGYSNTFAITRRGELYAWGKNRQGQLGLGDTKRRNTPTKVNVDGVESWRSVSAGSMRTFAITSTGELYAWGNNYKGKLGLEVSNDTIPIKGKTSREQRLKAFRKSNVIIPTKVIVDGVDGWRSISTGEHTLAITRRGKLYAWSDNEQGQLGLGDTIDRSTPTEVKVAGVNSWYKVSVGHERSFAITSTGALYAWGRNELGVLGLGDTKTRNTPTEVKVAGVHGWHDIAAGFNLHVLAIARDGQLYVWGRETLGEVGLGRPFRTYHTPQLVSTVDNVSGQNSTRIKDKVSGMRISIPGMGVIDTGNMEKMHSGVKNRDSISRWHSVQAAGMHFSLAITTDGALYAWGGNSNIVLPFGDNKNRERPTRVPMSFFSD